MEYTKIPNIDIDITRIGLGTWSIGGWLWGGTNEQDSIDTIKAAFDKGINLIDTAPVYGFGLAEEFCGKAVKELKNRDKIVIATKCGLSWHNQKVFRDSSGKTILKEINDSLRRLDTDYIDLYQVHWPDPDTALEKTAEILNTLMEKGKIKAIGTSNFSPGQMEQFSKEAPLHTNQPPYNLFEREMENDVLPYCRENGIKTLAYGSICQGLLSGKMTSDTKFEGDDNRKTDKKFTGDTFSKYLQTVEKLDNFAIENYGKRVIDLAIRWILDRDVEIALFGARKPYQLDKLENIFGWKINTDAMKAIDEILEEALA
ncbi:aldo/keto reductase [Bacteroidota bacterium]